MKTNFSRSGRAEGKPLNFLCEPLSPAENHFLWTIDALLSSKCWLKATNPIGLSTDTVRVDSFESKVFVWNRRCSSDIRSKERKLLDTVWFRRQGEDNCNSLRNDSRVRNICVRTDWTWDIEADIYGWWVWQVCQAKLTLAIGISPRRADASKNQRNFHKNPRIVLWTDLVGCGQIHLTLSDKSIQVCQLGMRIREFVRKPNQSLRSEKLWQNVSWIMMHNILIRSTSS
jgi:hypothetical protein